MPFHVLCIAALLLASGDEPNPERPPLDRSGSQWAPFLEWQLENPGWSRDPFGILATVTFTHGESGETRTTGMFYDRGDTWKFRFTATRPGSWTFLTRSTAPNLAGWRGTVTVKPRPDSPGFVGNRGEKWIRTGTGQAFVPQYVMFAGPHWYHGKPEVVDEAIQTFMVEHGFTGFHVPVFARWFDLHQSTAHKLTHPDPRPDRRTFEALELFITKVYEAGGVTHIWMWGDDAHGQTQNRWKQLGLADRRLLRTIAARLGPIPGWTMGYGYDLWEWTDEKTLDGWHEYLHKYMGWPHLLGARARKNVLTQMSEKLDYSSYLQYRPGYDEYVAAIEARPKKPSFSEDRFRIRDPSPYPGKDYDEVLTRSGQWHSAMAGGVANIWGRLIGKGAGANDGSTASVAYEHPHWIQTPSRFFRDRFRVDLRRDFALVADGSCLRNPEKTHFLFYCEDTDAVEMDLSGLAGPLEAVAVDALSPYGEIEIGKLEPGRRTWLAPQVSDWAIAVGNFAE